MDFIGGAQNHVLNTAGIYERSIPNLVVFQFQSSTALVYRGLNNQVADANNYIVPVGKNLIIRGIRILGTIDASGLVTILFGAGTTVTNTSTPPTGSVNSLAFQAYFSQTAITEIKLDCRCRVDSGYYPFLRASVTGASVTAQIYCTIEDNT